MCGEGKRTRARYHPNAPKVLAGDGNAETTGAQRPDRAGAEPNPTEPIRGSASRLNMRRFAANWPPGGATYGHLFAARVCRSREWPGHSRAETQQNGARPFPTMTPQAIALSEPTTTTPAASEGEAPEKVSGAPTTPTRETAAPLQAPIARSPGNIVPRPPRQKRDRARPS